jgi:hypothetical protein
MPTFNCVLFKGKIEFTEMKQCNIIHSTRNRLGLDVMSEFSAFGLTCCSILRSRYTCTLSNHRLNNGFKSPLHVWTHSRKIRIV